MSESVMQLKQERAALMGRLEDSQRALAALRARLQASQEELSRHESDEEVLSQRLAALTAQLTEAESKRPLLGPDLAARLIDPIAQERASAARALEEARAALSATHEASAALAQSLGPAFQQQKRFEQALASIDALIAQQSTAQLAQPAPAAPAIKPKEAPAAPPAEERRPARVPLGVETRFESFSLEVDQESDHNFYIGFTDNISEGGVFIATEQVIDMGTALRFELKLPNMSAPELVEGAVRWLRRSSSPDPDVPNGVGVQFTSLSPSLKRSVEEFVKRRESIFYDD